MDNVFQREDFSMLKRALIASKIQDSGALLSLLERVIDLRYDEPKRLLLKIVVYCHC
jgi:hypothetical protein